jgi:hypothetical protein
MRLLGVGEAEGAGDAVTDGLGLGRVTAAAPRVAIDVVLVERLDELEG